jgi:hypothetical protein
MAIQRKVRTGNTARAPKTSVILSERGPKRSSAWGGESKDLQLSFLLLKSEKIKFLLSSFVWAGGPVAFGIRLLNKI